MIPHRLLHPFALSLVLLLLAGCGEDETGALSDPGPDASSFVDAATEATADAARSDASPDTGASDSSDDPTELLPICTYVNPFSGDTECKAYAGADWDDESAARDCEAPSPGAAPGSFELESACSLDASVGLCRVEGADGYVLYLAGSDADACGPAQTGCEVFAGGVFEGSAICEGGATGGGEPITGVFLPPTESCAPPLEGDEFAGDEVCTNVAISGATAEGLRFDDYASCDTVRTQRPYYGVAARGETDPNDPRLEDEAFMAEVRWAREQVEATGCVCCHSVESAPGGVTSDWFIEEAIWLDTVSDAGLALFAGWADSRSLGAYPSESNNGFDRETLGLPTTDIERMRALIEGELGRRGVDRNDPEAITPFGGPIYDQLVYDPERCTRGEGVSSDGEVEWNGLSARYIYVLEPGSENPGVPPNLDLPEGTVWRLDVDPSAQPLASGVPYGETPDGARQVFPEGDVAPLTPGAEYYLYVLLDVGVPLTRCLFTYDG